MPPFDVDDPFYRALKRIIEDKMSERATALVDGAARRSHADDPVSVAEKYAEQTSYIRALKDCLEWAHAVYLDRYGGGDRGSNNTVELG